MQRTKIPCQFCEKSVSKSNLAKHEASCKEKQARPSYLPIDGSLTCTFCGKHCNNKNSLVNHSRLCVANPQRKLTGGLMLFNERRKVAPELSWNKGLTKDTDIRVKKISEGLLEYYTTHPGTGTGRIWSEESRQKVSAAATKSNLTKFERPSGKGHRGYYKNIYCQSSWELAYVIYCFDHNIEFKRNTDHFKYEFGGKIRNYFPDFYLMATSTYIEIKGYNDARSKAKAAQFPNKLKVYTKLEMQPILDYVISTYGKDFIRLYESN